MEHILPLIVLFGTSLLVFGLTVFALWRRWRGPGRIRQAIKNRLSPVGLRSELRSSFRSLLFYVVLGALIGACLLVFAWFNCEEWQKKVYRGTFQQRVALYLVDSALRYGTAKQPLPVGEAAAVFLGVALGGWQGMRWGMKAACGRYFITKGMI